MANLRTIIRDGFKDFLASKMPPGISVTASRQRLIADPDELPLINVVLGAEQAEVFNEAPRIYERTLQLTVECYAKDKGDAQAASEALMNYVEYIIDREDLFTLQPYIEEIFYKGSDNSPDGRESTRETSVAQIRYDIRYKTTAGKIFDDAEDFDEMYANISDLISTEITDIHQ